MQSSPRNAWVSDMKIGTEKRRYTVEPVLSPVPPKREAEPAPASPSAPPAPVQEPAETHA
jgi:hypothetical protein